MLTVMRPADIQFLIKLGVLDLRADEGTAFMVFTFVCNDPVVWKRSFERIKAEGNNSVSGGDPYRIPKGVVAEMTDSERAALCERVFEKASQQSRNSNPAV